MNTPDYTDSLSFKMLQFGDIIMNSCDTASHSLEQIEIMHDAIAGLRRASQALAPQRRLRERIILERRWCEDEGYVKMIVADKGVDFITAWKQHIADEFDSVGVSAAVPGKSVANWFSRKVKIDHKDGNLTAKFTVIIDCLHGDVELDGMSNAETIGHLFFKRSEVAGKYYVLGLGDEADA